MASEQKSINIPIKDRLDTASVVEIADFYNRVVRQESQKNPELDSYDLFKMVASNLPGKISDDTRQKAINAMTSEDEKMRLAGKRAFQFLSLRSIFNVVDSNLIKQGLYASKDRVEMLDSTILFVMENAPSLKGKKDQISARVTNLAISGLFLYHLKKRDSSLIGELDREQNTALIEIIKESKDGQIGVDAYRKEELKRELRDTVDVLPDRVRREVILRSFGLGEEPEKSLTQIARDLGYCGPTISMHKKDALINLKHDLQRKTPRPPVNCVTPKHLVK